MTKQDSRDEDHPAAARAPSPGSPARTPARRVRDAFLGHPRSVGQGYGGHALTAGAFGVTLIGVGLACLVHAVLPMLFVRTASIHVERLHRRMTHRISPTGS